MKIDKSTRFLIVGLGLLGGSYAKALKKQGFSVENLIENSLQSDKVYKEYYKLLQNGCHTLDIDQCPDLGPVLMALAAA